MTVTTAFAFAYPIARLIALKATSSWWIKHVIGNVIEYRFHWDQLRIQVRIIEKSQQRIVIRSKFTRILQERYLQGRKG
jgi:hypothetical protein